MEKEIDLMDLIKKIWGNKKQILVYGAIGAIAGIVVAFSIPKEYTATVKFTAEGSKKSQNSMSELAGFVGINVGSEAPDGINANLYPEVIKSTPFMTEIANIEVQVKDVKMPMYEYVFKHQRKAWWGHIKALPGTIIKLFSQKDSAQFNKTPPLQKGFAYLMSEKIQLSLEKKTNVYTITSTFQNPVIATQVADSVLYKLQRYMTDYKTRKTRANLESNLKILKQAQKDYYTADSIYAFKSDRNQNLTLKGTKIKIDRLENERDLTYQIYKQLASQVASDKVKIQEETPIATIIEPAIVPNSSASPNKIVIILAGVLLGAFGITAKLVIKELTKLN